MGRILGLDISETAVRGTVVTSTFRQTQVSRYVEVPIDLATGAERDRTAAVHDAIAELLASMEQPPDTVVCALDGREASLRVVELPAGAGKRVDEVLPFELEAMLPFAVEDTVVDHQPIGQDATTLRLLACAVPTSRVGDLLAEVRAAGLEPREIAVGAAALDGLVPLLPALAEEGPFLLVQVDETSTDICILRERRCELARTLSGGMREVRSGRRAALETQIRHTVASYRASGGENPRLALLGGEAAAFPQAVDWLRGVLEVDTQVVPLPPVAGSDDAHRPRFIRSTALAGRLFARGKRLNLRKGAFALQRTMGGVRRHSRLIAICAAAVFLSFGFSIYARWTVLGDEHKALQARLEKVTGDLFGTASGDPQQVEAIIEHSNQRSDPLPRFDAYDALAAISDLIPADLTHKHDTRRLEIDLDDSSHEGHFELQGTVDTIAERDSIAASLESHRCFKDLEKGRTSPGPGNQGLNYQLEAKIRCPGASGGDQSGKGADDGDR